MPLSFQEKKRLYNACNPEEALSPEDRRNVDLNVPRGRSEPVLGTDWIARLSSDNDRELKKILLEAGDAYRRVALGHGVQAMRRRAGAGCSVG